MYLDERVRAALAAETRFSDVRLLEVVDSTNRLVADLAAGGAPEGLVVAAELQIAGRGRLDRTWEAARGAALLVSVLLRPAGLETSRWHLLTAAAGLAALDACEAVAGVIPELKWPNDLMIGSRKLAGILAETSGAAVVVGMGLNVHGGPPGCATLDEAAGWRVSREELLEKWLRGYDRLLDDWEEVSDRYRRECSTVGRLVMVEQASGARLVGLASHLDPDGRLVILPDDGGHPVSVSAGDVVHLRPQGGTW